ncbi:nuclear transport factor 2 family protein [Adhaeribacter radiodurans]|uniref:Nuclear transport factor 2 family protein n=1 Tax=Adhaeribacter radiodurans TaxID=2745197 RepID=A0A7L7L946_9BACT|nr:nuclear transport factor 2 family protein [Adhaeribacter radiodurans]QMU29025.1 nuclear transport factor 2 family protein [Adhaeribacter radiodurans]
MQTLAANLTQILNHHIEAIKSRDLQANMIDYHENAILILGEDVFRGKEAIQGFFKFLFESIFTEGFTIDIQKQVIEEDIIYIVWQARSSTYEIPQATDTFLIQDGLILRQTGFAIMNPI